MSDYEYVDEDGNPIDPSTLGDDVEIIEYVDDDGADDLVEADADDEPTPAPALADARADVAELPKLGRKGGLVLAGVGVAVIAVLGGVVFGLAGIGSQNTVDDVKAGASSKYAQASSSVVASKSSEVSQPELDSCADASRAVYSGKKPPKVQLRVLDSAPAPASFVAARKDVPNGVIDLLQLSRDSFGVYAFSREANNSEGTAGAWSKTTVTSENDTLALTDEGGEFEGSDTEAASDCDKVVGKSFLVEGAPSGALGMKDGQYGVVVYHGDGSDADRGLVLFDDPDNTIALVTLEYVEGGDAGDGE